MKEEIIQILKNSDGYVSGESISTELNVTRAAVWKAVNSLRAQGYNIVSMKHYGYRLEDMDDVLNMREIAAVLGKSELLNDIKIQYFAEVDSTNLAARRDIDKFGGTTLYIADQQLAGRGRLGRFWLSEAGCGLWFSLMFSPQAQPQNLANLTLFTGLCVQRALVKKTGLNIGIKWPNDLVVLPTGKKICGILTETVLEDMQVRAVIAGIGINVNNSVFPNELNELATSLKIESGKENSRTELLAAVLHEFCGNYHEFEQDQSKPGWLDAYKRVCVTIGREVTITENGDTLSSGRAVDLTEDGDLMVKLSDGSMKICHTGEVSVRGILGYI